MLGIGVMQQDESAQSGRIEIETIRSEALRKVGRNVVNFARLESGLKILLSLCISGSPKDLKRKKRRRIRENHRKTLGNLTMQIVSSLEKGHDNLEDIPENLDDIHISLSFSVGDDKGSRKFRESLLELVKDRNNLIHHRLAELDSTSVDIYRMVIEYLDEQQKRIIEKLDSIGILLDLLDRARNVIVSDPQGQLSKFLLTCDSCEAQQQDPPDPPPMSQ
ncbi:hypothetical protein Cyagr_2376 [Cyanobium gracile PCC 6307]|uniref:Uncharacterized protein n=1 Tax=Cyanobium gracile (strain ATCC 27147 / PCC 6307) TaxID=292564 RepID=K9P7W0_CYAGP|nr:hypothetical protein Cyagr_2376 [Cyanobium gracile PCC 6307]